MDEETEAQRAKQLSQDLDPVLTVPLQIVAERGEARLRLADLKFSAFSPTVCRIWASYFSSLSLFSQPKKKKGNNNPPPSSSLGSNEVACFTILNMFSPSELEKRLSWMDPLILFNVYGWS